MVVSSNYWIFMYKYLGFMKTKDATLEIPFETVVKKEFAIETPPSSSSFSRDKVLKETTNRRRRD